MTEQLDIVDATLIFNTIQKVNTALSFDVLNVYGLNYAEWSCLRAYCKCSLWVHSHCGLRSQGLSNILRNRLHFNFGGLLFKMAETTLRPNNRLLFVLFGLFEVVLLFILSNMICGLREVGFIQFKRVIVIADMLAFRAQ